MIKDYIVLKTTAGVDKDGMHRTVIATPERIRTSDCGVIVPQSDIFDDWFKPVMGFPGADILGYDFVTDSSPLYEFGFRLKNSRWDKSLESVEFKRGRNIIVSMQWEADFQRRSWNLIIEHTDSILSLPPEMFPSIIERSEEP